MRKSFFLILFCFPYLLFSQSTKRTLKAKRTTSSPKIDGILNDIVWQNVDIAKGFVMKDPGSGDLEPENRKSTVKVIYDDDAIYFAAELKDSNPNDISRQFSSRDQIGQTDYFQVNINPNNDGLNDTEFIVMSTGVQADAKAKNGGGNSRRKDFSWSAVWYSQVTITDDGWVVEMKIPYSALRFANTEVQNWGINFFRKMHKHNEEYSWSLIDKTKGSYTQYSGSLNGIENVKPPVRLNFSPYASLSLTNNEDGTEFEKSIGMDLKYGINESFTLDATLIPDFGQTAFDEQVLNLGPFEQRYSEKRSFFTEGTELFGKGGLFYSRRIGNTPVNADELEDNLAENEEIIDSPDKVNMLNALKVSGRTKKGLGIGVFNAITEKTSATIENITTGEIRKEVTEPFANYSVLVLDQQFNKNSSVSLINTNVLRNGSFRDANVIGALFDISDKNNKYNIDGHYKLSSVRENGETLTGNSTKLGISKTFGNLQYGIDYFGSNDTYDISDLGFQRRNNYSNYRGYISYRIFEPTEYFNSMRISLRGGVDYLFKPNEYTGNNVEVDAFFVLKNKFAFGLNTETGLGDQKDYYEPRVDGRFFKQNGVLETGAWVSTDYRKKFALDVRGGYALQYDTDTRFHSLNISPRYRFSDKFEVIYSIRFSKLINELGYVNELDNGDIIFGKRDVENMTNTIAGKLSFNTKSSVSLSFRYYWSPVTYEDDFYSLNTDGNLDDHTYFDNHNINYNIWNLDLSYSWEFAPGSQLVALYRNSLFKEDELSHLDFGKNLENLFKEPIANNISLKFIYYLDYNKLKTWL